MHFNENDLLINRYRLTKLIGKGGFSVVFKAVDEVTNVTQAIKIYAPDKGLDEKSEQQFSREYTLTQSLIHSNLLKSTHYDLIPELKAPFLVMPYCRNGSLASLLQDKDTLSGDELAKLMADIGDGLSYLHSREPSILHQDIKPDNILIGDDGNYLLTDFGISSKMRSTLKKSTMHNSALTVAYAPPEKYTNQETGAPSDIFSFGVMLYECLTGDVPWGGDGGVMLLKGAHAIELSSDYPDRLSKVIWAMTQKEPEKRPAAKQLAEFGRFFIQNGYWPDFEEFFMQSESPGKNHQRKSASTERKTEAISHEDRMNAGRPESSAETQATAQDKRKRKKGWGWAAVIALLILLTGGYFFGEDILKGSFSGKETSLAKSAIIDDAKSEPADNAGKLSDAENEKTTNDGDEPANKEETPPEKTQKSQKALSSEIKPSKKIAPTLTPESIVAWREQMDKFGTPESVHLSEFEKLNSRNSPEAKARLAYLYRQGLGVTQDYNKVMSLSREAASAGNAFAMYNIGYLYSNGYGIRKDTEKSIYWYEKASEAGDAMAQSNLGSRYLYGNGVNKDEYKAHQLFKKAAAQNYAGGQYNLAVTYETGSGTQQDFGKALGIYKKAAKQGYDYAQRSLAMMYDYGKGVPEDDEKAFKWYMKAAKQGNAEAMNRLGEMYDNGTYVSQDWNTAFGWYKKAANAGNAFAQKELGEFYLFGVGGASKNADKAKALFREAAKNGHQKARTYTEVLEQADQINSREFIKAGSNGKNITVTYKYRRPHVMNNTGNGWSEYVTYDLGSADYVRIWPASSSIYGDRQKDEIYFTNYSSSELYTSDGEKKVSISSKEPQRSIGYIYVVAAFSDENLVVKLPVALCWPP